MLCLTVRQLSNIKNYNHNFLLIIILYDINDINDFNYKSYHQLKNSIIIQ